MKLFISADIEGCAGLALPAETHKNEAVYQAFARQMTREVLAACQAAHEMGAEQIVVKDGHGDASNIDPLQMPDYVTLIRGKSGHPYNMMWGIDDSFDGVLYIGYHAPAGNPEFSISHTSTGNSLYLRLNGEYMSEFMLNSYTAASHGVPVLFLSGDEAICSLAKELVPEMETAVTKRGVGGATLCEPQGVVLERIRAGVKKALEKDPSLCRITLPESFTYEVTFKDWKKAYQMSFYPGMKSVDTFTNRLVTDRWMDVVTAHCFVVY
ncbi:MAG: M55 family metallopeptidase [Lachnospiraceae bacterium]|nr:M55 family metallopeptidase [Lachnospiraceae bacterium]